MKTYNMDKNSWHYRLVQYTLGGQGSMDICTYIRKVFLAFIASLIMISLIVISTVVVGIGLFGIGAAIYMGDISRINPASVLDLAVVAVFLCIKLQQMVEDKQKNTPKTESTSFIRLAYKKFKSKTCFMVDFK